jgi:hypothetical protein
MHETEQFDVIVEVPDLLVPEHECRSAPRSGSHEMEAPASAERNARLDARIQVLSGDVGHDEASGANAVDDLRLDVSDAQILADHAWHPGGVLESQLN